MKQFLIIGAGRFGGSIATTLYNMGNDVLIIDDSEEAINQISGSVTHAIQGNAADERLISTIGANNFDVCVIAMGSDIQSSILVAIMLKEAGARYIVAKAQNELHAKVLYKVGVDKIVFPERDMGAKIAQSLVSSNIMDYIELSPEYSIVEITAIKEWIGKNLLELNMRAKYGINIMAIKKGTSINISPTALTVIEEGDVLIVIGHNSDLKKLERKV
ncbi:trk system potassium uptake protein TrkA [Caminicella sporogenes DSM 14501]|uniref:Trk system potassium uptake protein TrkA n=1 Tax=Caminicella sporogenes DSM 14501 TaxID=1121266 RepID=A0A1M6QT47_9FIRM|nr:TrkA family potassium uptake protein [Caminicella sporogenes]RKD20921.1 potassium transporter Trk [Caminicella sporogenes]SHK23376.1 trk system potassium uptake protein TrkA [Caminicella sporogenes DSM 14501]